MLFPLTLTSILVSLAIALLSCLIMARYRDLFDKVKIPLAILTLIGGLIIYTLGYLPENTAEEGGNGTEVLILSENPVDFATVALRALFSTCRIFILENDISEVNSIMRADATYMLFFGLVHASALILTVLTFLSFFGLQFISRIKILLARPDQTYLFFGMNEPSRHLIKSIRSHGRRRCIIIVENKPDKSENEGSFIKDLRETRCILIDQNPLDVMSLKKLGLPKRFYRKLFHTFMISDGENQNIKAALSLMKYIKKDRIPDEHLMFYIRSATEGIERIFEDANTKNLIKIDCKIFSTPDLIARQLMEKCPIVENMIIDSDTATVKNDFNLLIVGFDRVGVEVLRKSLYCGQFIGGTLKANVLDGSMKSKEGTFNNRFNGINQNYSINYIEAIPGSHAFYDVLSKKIHELSYVVVALDNDQLSMETAIEIQRLIKRRGFDKMVTIAVQISSPELFIQFEDKLNYPNIRLFGGMPDIYTESIIINESMDKMARSMNALFNSIYHIEPVDNWTHLDAFTRESNRSASMNIRTKLKLVGLEMSGKEVSGVISERLEDYLMDERLHNLAMQEHLRWNAFHFSSGWTTWDLADTEGAIKAKDSKNKRHACLVSWGRLQEVTARFNQDPSYEALDVAQIKNIPFILDEVGFVAYKK